MTAQEHRIIRPMLLGILVFGLIGTAVELLFLGHDESLTQLVPLVLIATGIAVITWHMLLESRSSLLVLRITMVAFVAVRATSEGEKT